MNNEYDNIDDDEFSLDSLQNDSGEIIRYPYLQHFNGNGADLVDENGELILQNRKPVSAMGTYINITKAPEALMKVVKKMLAEGTGESITVQHSKKTENSIQRYFKPVGPWTLFPLTLNAPSIDQIRKDIRQLTGYATGLYIQWDKEFPGREPAKGTYNSQLMICKELFENGYQDEDGNPLPVGSSWKSYNAGDMQRIMQSHAAFIKDLRSWPIAPLNSEHKVREEIEFWEYAISLDLSEKWVPRGKAPKITDCYIMVNVNSDPKKWTPELEKKLWCGEVLYQLMKPMVYKFSMGRRRPGGVAHDFALKVYEKNTKRLLELDPENKLPLGKINTVPSEWLISDELKRSASLRSAVNGESQPFVKPLSSAEKITNMLNGYRDFFGKSSDVSAKKAGLALVALASTQSGEELANTIVSLEELYEATEA